MLRSLYKLTLLSFFYGLYGCSLQPASDALDDNDWQPGVTAVFDANAVRGRVLEYGIYDTVHDGGIITAPGTNTGKAHGRSTLKLHTRTQRIAIKKGRFFGFKVRLEPFPGRRSIELKKVVQHPPMTLPDGSIKHGYAFIERKKVDQQVVFALAGYFFDEPYEMVAGDWVFQYWLGDKLLVEQKFTTYFPGNGAS